MTALSRFGEIWKRKILSAAIIAKLSVTTWPWSNWSSNRSTTIRKPTTNSLENSFMYRHSSPQNFSTRNGVTILQPTDERNQPLRRLPATVEEANGIRSEERRVGKRV